MTFHAAIFDMDGLLLDTERICRDCFLQAGKLVGVEIDLDVYHTCIGNPELITRAKLIAGHGDDFPYEEIRAIWWELYHEAAMSKPVPLKPGVESLLQAIADANTPIALATSSRYQNALTKLGHAGLTDYFDLVVGGDQVSQGKPHPEIYLKAAGDLGKSPEDCIAFEDSENGVRAALAAGLHVIQVPDLVPPSADLKAAGHTIVDSLLDFRWGHAPGCLAGCRGLAGHES